MDKNRESTVNAEYIPQKATTVNTRVLTICETRVEPLFLSHKKRLESPKRRVVIDHHLWYSHTSKYWEMTYARRLASMVRGVLVKMVRTEGITQSASEGV